jgi:hypothetical protein
VGGFMMFCTVTVLLLFSHNVVHWCGCKGQGTGNAVRVGCTALVCCMHLRERASRTL